MWDDDEGYDTADPKHSQWAGNWLAYADHIRKYERENRVSAPSPAAQDAREDGE